MLAKLGYRYNPGLTALLAFWMLVMLANVIVGSFKLQHSPWEYWPVLLYIVSVPFIGTFRALVVIDKAENTDERGLLLDYAYSTALLFPIVAGVIPVSLMMRFARWA